MLPQILSNVPGAFHMTAVSDLPEMLDTTMSMHLTQQCENWNTIGCIAPCSIHTLLGIRQAQI